MASRYNIDEVYFDMLILWNFDHLNKILLWQTMLETRGVRRKPSNESNDLSSISCLHIYQTTPTPHYLQWMTTITFQYIIHIQFHRRHHLHKIFNEIEIHSISQRNSFFGVIDK